MIIKILDKTGNSMVLSVGKLRVQAWFWVLVFINFGSSFWPWLFLTESRNLISFLSPIRTALLHKPICKGFFSDIIFKWRSLHTKSIAQPIGPHITEHSWVAEILPFGLILLRNGMRHQKANKGEIKPTPTQPSNAA